MTKIHHNHANKIAYWVSVSGVSIPFFVLVQYKEGHGQKHFQLSESDFTILILSAFHPAKMAG